MKSIADQNILAQVRALILIGTIERRSGEPERAVRYGEEALAIARNSGHRELELLVLGMAQTRDYWSPAGRRRVLPAAQFADWLGAFLPELAAGSPPQLLTPALVSDRSDGQIVHLDGLNLSRAWCMWGIAATLPPDDPRGPVLLDAARRHAEAGLAAVDSGDYMGDHWLGSFALYMLSCAPASPQ